MALGCSEPRDLPLSRTPAPARSACTDRPSASAAGPRPWLNQKMGLAPTKTGTRPVRGLPMIVLTTCELRLLGANEFALRLPPRAAWSRGFAADQKQGGENGLFLTRFGGWLNGTRQAGDRDIDVMVDRIIPFRMLVEVLFTSAQSGYRRFHLIVQGPHGPAQIVIHVPEAVDRRPASIAVIDVREGVSIKVPGGNVAPGCDGFGPGIAIARHGTLPATALTRCLARLSRASPELGGARILANPDTPFAEIVALLDAVRSVPAFRQVAFGVPE